MSRVVSRCPFSLPTWSSCGANGKGGKGREENVEKLNAMLGLNKSLIGVNRPLSAIKPQSVGLLTTKRILVW